MWQGRLALYGFIADEGNSESFIIRKPRGGEDFTDDNSNPGDASIITNNQLNENARMFHWDAGKILAERNISDTGNGDPRNIRAVELDFSDSSNINIDQYGVIRYLGQTIELNNSVPPLYFGIGEADLSEPAPEFCNPEEEIDECYRDEIVSFLSGRTGIIPVRDGLGQPRITDGDDSDIETIGINCFNVETGNGSFDNCQLKLGDIFNSAPSVSASPSVLSFDTGFQEYSRMFRTKSAVVYAGSNSGMLHAFHAGELIESGRNPFTGGDEILPFYNTGTGEEIFAFIPPTFSADSISEIDPHNHFQTINPLLDINPDNNFNADYRFGDFKNYILNRDIHRSFFDGTPIIQDVFIDVFIDGFTNGISTVPTANGRIESNGSEWHTVLLAGFRNGGGGYTALDITNIKCTVGEDSTDCGKLYPGGPEHATHLWTLFDSDFGNSWSNPRIRRVRLNTSDNTLTDRWVAFVGGGLDPDPDDNLTFGNAFYAIDIPTGQIIYKFHPSRSIPDNLGSDQETLSSQMVCELASDPRPFDLNSDGYEDLVYIGDTCGRVWRFDISQPLETNSSIGSTGITSDGNGIVTRGSAEITAPNWTASIAFCANDDANCRSDGEPVTPSINIEPIFFAPTIVINIIGERHVIFQTGNRRNPTDDSGGSRLYNFIDRYVPAFLAGGLNGSPITQELKTRQDIQDETLKFVRESETSNLFVSDSSNFRSVDGEFVVEFPDAGEKGIGTPIVLNRVLVFTSFSPPDLEETLPCEIDFGESRVFAVDFFTGESALTRIRGINETIDNLNSSHGGFSISEGIAANPTLSTTGGGTVILSISASGNPEQGGINFIFTEFTPLTPTQTLFWEEVL